MEKIPGLEVYKFGGASVKDAAAILNLCRIVRDFGPQGPLMIVVSAMGKTTNALEVIYDLAYRGEDYSVQLAALENYHKQACTELAESIPTINLVQLQFQLQQLTTSLAEELQFMHQVHMPESYDQGYDQVVSHGERFSALLTSSALAQFLSTAVRYVPAQLLLQTDEVWREGKVDWPVTEAQTSEFVNKALTDATIIVTEGFLGGTANGRTTTLGREGSDYTAAILAYCLRAEAVTIWKDVAGLLNADPKIFPDTVRYPEISYRETIEMAYYGASVIHPKTLKPLADRNIPLRVKSFLDPAAAGTLIHDCQHPALAPAFIRKTDQCLLSFASKDFSFISEENLAVIFAALALAKLKINVMQNSAISFSVCTDFVERRVHQLLDLLREQFTLHYNTGLQLFTIKNYDAASIAQLTAGKRLLLEQRTRSTFQFVCQA
ncbi:aspartate kinase [Hymenobacter properus]|uniref:Aspartokinase n=1 Tax=Hymenobacter properus TaxID=2791026 RepID=A0A931BKR1_9BACT|nr:aspartate kinase [Hymenobacter properus]MBF9144023.1 aspartate kinase [Hymenobacter properus]MBR7722840.1 aspartate kinase [Microvirga sp. SRT04]